MNALNRQATGVALALCQDAFGNLWAGQEERTLGYLKLAIQLLSQIESNAESKGDVREERALRATITEMLDAADNLQPEFDHSISGEAHAKWATKGITPEGTLRHLNAETLPGDHPLHQPAECLPE